MVDLSNSLTQNVAKLITKYSDKLHFKFVAKAFDHNKMLTNYKGFRKRLGFFHDFRFSKDEKQN